MVRIQKIWEEEALDRTIAMQLLRIRLYLGKTQEQVANYLGMICLKK